MLNNNETENSLNLIRIKNALVASIPILESFGLTIIENKDELHLYTHNGECIANLELRIADGKIFLEAQTPKGLLVICSELTEDDFERVITKTTVEYGDIDLNFKGKNLMINLTTDERGMPLEMNTTFVDSTNEYLKTEINLNPELINIVLSNPENPYGESLDDFCQSREIYYSTEENPSDLLQMSFGSWETTATGKESQLILSRFLGENPEMYSLKYSKRALGEEDCVHEDLLEFTLDMLPIIYKQLLSASRNKAVINHALESISKLAPDFETYLINYFSLFREVQTYNQNNKAILSIEEILMQAQIPECDLKSEKETREIAWFGPFLL